MSHFTVLVAAKNKEDLEARLLPYHEYECNWWQIGGRFTGTLRLKTNRVILATAGNGTPGLMTAENVDPKYADFAPAGEVDWDGMANDWRGRQRRWYGEHRAYFELAKNGRAPKKVTEKVDKLWNDTTGLGEAARQTFIAFQTAIDYEYARSLAVEDNNSWWHDWEDITKILMTQEEFERTIDKPKAHTYAFIDLQGNWQQRGKMGWFGMDDKEKGTPDYDSAWWGFVRSIPINLIVYVIDCHI